MAEAGARALRAELIEWFRDADATLDADTALDADATLGERAFQELARRVFARNFHAVPAYRAYCEARGVTPESLEDWTGIPAVPTAAFKELTLRAGDRPVERVFRTSGTTRGRERRGEHHVADLELYRASARAAFRSFLLPDRALLPFLSLMPSADALPDSSLAFMISDVADAFGREDSRTFADASGVDFDGLEEATDRAAREATPVLLLGTSAAFIHWLDRLESRDRSFRLPPGSRLMDTGGYKGKGRTIEPAALRALYERRLGLPAHACVNEYGMTELLSQRYDRGLRDHEHGVDDHEHRVDDHDHRVDAPSRKLGPPWLRTVAVDPETLEPVADGERGILRHLDLANLDSVAAIQTEDFGRIDRFGLVLEGRSTGAPPRGCSLAMDLLLGGVP